MWLRLRSHRSGFKERGDGRLVIVLIDLTSFIGLLLLIDGKLEILHQHDQGKAG
jgi:hypothetical protein